MVNRHPILTHLMHYVYSDAQTQLSQTLNFIFADQAALLRDSSDGFWFKGKCWRNSSHPRPATKPLHKSLHVTMSRYLQCVHELENEQQYVDAYLRAAINSSTHSSDLYHLLPSTLHQVLNNLGIPRTDKVSQVEDLIPTHNQKGYELLLTRLLLNLTGVS